MTTANQVTGETGGYLVYGLDIKAGLQTAPQSQGYAIRMPWKKGNWTKSTLGQLADNSGLKRYNFLAYIVMRETGMPPDTVCRYHRSEGRRVFIRVDGCDDVYSAVKHQWKKESYQALKKLYQVEK